MVFLKKKHMRTSNISMIRIYLLYLQKVLITAMPGVRYNHRRFSHETPLWLGAKDGFFRRLLLNKLTGHECNYPIQEIFHVFFCVIPLAPFMQCSMECLVTIARNCPNLQFLSLATLANLSHSGNVALLQEALSCCHQLRDFR